MSELPRDIISEILSFLPSESLPRFKCICKAWREIINSLAFFDLHSHRQIELNQVMVTGATGELYLISLSSVYNLENTSTTIQPTRVENLFPARLQLLSSDGLILNAITHANEVNKLWNPVTGELLELHYTDNLVPKPRGMVVTQALGFDYITNDFKVVMVYRNLSREFRTLIFSLNSNKWNLSKERVCDEVFRFSDKGVLFKGKIHWLIDTNPGVDSAKRILALDLRTESYNQFRAPLVTYGDGLMIPGMQLDAWDGCLFTILCYGKQFNVWKMKEYEQVWSPVISVILSTGNNVRLLGYIKRQNMALIQIQKELLLFDTETKYCIKRVAIMGLEWPHISAQAFRVELHQAE